MNNSRSGLVTAAVRCEVHAGRFAVSTFAATRVKERPSVAGVVVGVGALQILVWLGNRRRMSA
jgi:hypothetical protein